MDFDVKFGDKTYSVTGGGVPTGTDAGTYEITYTIKPDSNHVISDADAKKTIRVTINPKQINVDYSPLSFTYGTPVVINAAPKDENAIARRDNGKIAITVTPDNDNNVGKHTATAEINNSNYTISPSTVVYEITQAKADPAAVPTPSLHSIEYGQQAQEAELTEGWNCPVVNSSERPNAGNHYGQAVYEADYHNYDYSNVPGYDPTTGKVTAEIKLEVTAKDLHAYWSESGEFVYNGKKQIPAIDNSKTKGFVEENNDSQYYVIKPKSVDPEKYDCTSAGAQKVTAELVTNDEEKRPVTNYNLIIEENDYNISTATIKDIDKVGTTVTYGDNTSSVKAVREALKAEILKKVPDFDKNYIILDDFGVENKTEDDVLVVDTYSSRIHYTCIKQDAATGETKADSNYEGWFTATVDVLPKEIAVQWKSNAEFNKETGNNEIVFGVIPDVKPELAAGALCNRDKDEKLDVKVSPADKNGVGDYTVTASLDDKNYKLSNTEYKYTIIKATPSIKLEDKYTATYGDKLSDIADQLPKDDNGTYTWKNENAPVGDAGENTHIVVYKPNDDKNNNIVETEVTVKVNPKEVNLIWNIDNGEKFTYNGEAQNVDAYADLNDVFDKDEPSFKLDITADDLVNAGENHKAVATIRDENNNAKNYKIVEGKESITFDILKSSSLQDLNYSETYEYGTTAKEIFDDLFAKHFGDFSAFAEQYSVDPESVEVYKNGKKIETEKLKNYAKSCLKAQDLIFEGDIIKTAQPAGCKLLQQA
ncbi:hypothetical protein [Ruminococcus sp. HUN007]|uniref:hypothetical protein n=1 Tax=Ruminococcus sp. HUN007 TaxID=1514668 RepID=UPI0005D28EF4|nr:hypothetical protein [Ruminococcus sp. HUN007]